MFKRTHHTDNVRITYGISMYHTVNVCLHDHYDYKYNIIIVIIVVGSSGITFSTPVETSTLIS